MNVFLFKLTRWRREKRMREKRRGEAGKGREALDIKTDFHVSTSEPLRQYQTTLWYKFSVQYCSGFTLNSNGEV